MGEVGGGIGCLILPQLFLALEEFHFERRYHLVGFDRLDVLRQRIHLDLAQAQAFLDACSARITGVMLGIIGVPPDATEIGL